MIIPDTSVWIEFFKGKEPYSFMMSMYMEDRSLIAAEVVFAELLQGARNKKELEVIHRYWSYLPKSGMKNLLIEAGMESSRKKTEAYEFSNR